MDVIPSAISFLNLHQDGPYSITPVKRQFSISRNVSEPLKFSCFQICAIQTYCQSNPNQTSSRCRRILNEVFELFDRSFLYIQGLSREGGRVWKMPEKQLADVRDWILIRVATRNQEEGVLAAQIISNLMQSLQQVSQYYDLANNLDLTETLCFLGYLVWAKGEGSKAPRKGCLARVVGGSKTLTARIILEPRSWADAMTVLRTEDLRDFKPQGIRGRKKIQLQAGGEVVLISVRIWVPTTSGRPRGFCVACIEQNPRDRRPIGSFGLAPGTLQLGVGSSMFIRMRKEQLMFKHSTGWHT
jgi:hypothetical protein